METFVVRVRESGQSEPGLRGVVDEVASGCRSTFHNAEELVMILTRAADHAVASPMHCLPIAAAAGVRRQ
jgi:hypothetical protein